MPLFISYADEDEPPASSSSSEDGEGSASRSKPYAMIKWPFYEPDQGESSRHRRPRRLRHDDQEAPDAAVQLVTETS